MLTTKQQALMTGFQKQSREATALQWITLASMLALVFLGVIKDPKNFLLFHVFLLAAGVIVGFFVYDWAKKLKNACYGDIDRLLDQSNIDPTEFLGRIFEANKKTLRVVGFLYAMIVAICVMSLFFLSKK